MTEQGEQSNHEERAQRMGWVSKDEFKGDPARWVDAETFVKNAENVMPHLKGTLSVMERKMAGQERTISELRDTLDAVRKDTLEFVQYTKNSEQRAYERAVKELQAQQRKAVEDGDVPAFDKVSADLDTLIAQHPAVTGKVVEGDNGKPVKPAVVDTEYQRWLEESKGSFEKWVAKNEWYDDIPEMFAYANQMDGFLSKKYGYTISQAERLEKITELVKEKFPEKWENPKRKAAVSVGSSDVAPEGAGKHTYANLPTEAKAQCDKWTGKDGEGKSGTITGLTREQYLKDYKWD